MPNSYTAIPITIDNTQTSATPAPFQQMITVDMSNYSSLANSTLSNVFFLDNNGNPITSWLESGNSNTSTSTVYWLLLPLGIPANSSITVYMCFDNTSNNDFDGITRGEAPQLSSTYAEYDNGTNVFSFYDNFKGTTLSSSWTNSGMTVTINNGLTAQATTSGTWGTLYNVAQNPNSYVMDMYAYFITLEAQQQAIGWNPQSSSTIQGWISDATTPSYTVADWNGSTGTNTNFSTSASTSSYNLISIGSNSASSEWYALLNYASVATLSTDWASTTSAEISMSSVTTTSNIKVQWLRTRAYPPNGTMPTTTFGTQTTKNMVSPTTLPSGALYYVPITLSNSQSSNRH